MTVRTRWMVGLLPLWLAACSGLPFGDAEGEARLKGDRWEWIAGGTASMPTTVGIPSRYTIVFQPEYRVEVRADCNRGFGPWGLEGGTVRIGPLTMSNRICGADTRGLEFQAGLEAANHWYVRDDSLYLELPYDRGVLRLARTPAEPQP